MKNGIAYYHLPGLFEFYELYSLFLPLFHEHREYFYDWCSIGSIYGAPSGCAWGGGREGEQEENIDNVLSLLEKYEISARLTFSNSLLKEDHLTDKKCNALCRSISLGKEENGVIVHSDLLKNYLSKEYPELYLISSTTKVLRDFSLFQKELDDPSFRYVVPDFRLNHSFEKLFVLSDVEKQKVEFLCNECCRYDCMVRKECYESVSRHNLNMEDNFSCPAKQGYRFSSVMKNPGFIGIDEIHERYLPMGFSHFKIEGRGLGSALVLEFLLYYMVKPEYQLHVREEIYLDNMLDLF